MPPCASANFMSLTIFSIAALGSASLFEARTISPASKPKTAGYLPVISYTSPFLAPVIDNSVVCWCPKRISLLDVSRKAAKSACVSAVACGSLIFTVDELYGVSCAAESAATAAGTRLLHTREATAGRQNMDNLDFFIQSLGCGYFLR